MDGRFVLIRKTTAEATFLARVPSGQSGSEKKMFQTKNKKCIECRGEVSLKFLKTRPSVMFISCNDCSFKLYGSTRINSFCIPVCPCCGLKATFFSNSFSSCEYRCSQPGCCGAVYEPFRGFEPLRRPTPGFIYSAFEQEESVFWRKSGVK